MRLTARDAFGGSVVSSERVVAEGDMKVGHFTVAFADMQVSLAGLPLTVTRMGDRGGGRDSRWSVGGRAGRSRELCPQDFGHGWKLDVDSLRLEKSHAAGAAWSMDVTVGTFSTPSTYQMTDDGRTCSPCGCPMGKCSAFRRSW